MVPAKKVDKTPYELWYEKVPNFSCLNFWRSKALMKRDTPHKLQQRFVKCIFVVYPKKTMGYCFYFPPENKIIVARYAKFLKKNLISQEANERAVKLKEIQDEDTSLFENTKEIPVEVDSFEPPQADEALVCRIRIRFEWGILEWKSSKQSTTAMSAIYIDASEAAMEAV
nr:hypothetical protein [Tanacetum cinerariifolium]